MIVSESTKPIFNWANKEKDEKRKTKERIKCNFFITKWGCINNIN